MIAYLKKTADERGNLLGTLLLDDHANPAAVEQAAALLSDAIADADASFVQF